MNALIIHEPEVGQYSQRSLQREAVIAARSTASAKGFKRARVDFWAVAPCAHGISLKVQVTATNPDGTWAQYCTAVAL